MFSPRSFPRRRHSTPRVALTEALVKTAPGVRGFRTSLLTNSNRELLVTIEGSWPRSWSKSKLGFAERAVVLTVRGAEGDFRDWDEIKAWPANVHGIVMNRLSGTDGAFRRRASQARAPRTEHT